MKKGTILDLEITGYAFEGKGIAKFLKDSSDYEEELKKFVVFVKGTYPGDKVAARISKIKKSYAEAKLLNILSPSKYRTTPKCSYHGVCGGCHQQDLEYEQQLKFKEEQVREIFERIGGFKQVEMLPIISSEKEYFYRNKMEFSFARKRWLTPEEISTMQEISDRDFAVGLHIPGLYDKVLNINRCFLQSELSNGILNFTREFFQTEAASIYSTLDHEGYLRNLVIRQSARTDDVMVNLVTSHENERLFINYNESLISKFPQITTVVNCINLKKALVAIGDYEKVFYGSGYIYDLIGEFKFRISANSFFQTNTFQAEKLYQTALEFSAFKGDETVYDLYSGAGTIPIFITKHVKKIFGFESIQSAINDAQVNIEINTVNNFTPILADLNKSFLPIVETRNLSKPTVLIADPPRSGMNPKTVKDVLTLLPEKIVYLSCNPSTQARDIKLICAGGYQLEKMQPVDMFPHTFHIENVALLIKK